MKAITLNDVIKKNLKDPEFKKLYEKEQLQLAEKAHTTQPAIARLESGKDSRTPSLDLLMKIAEATGFKINIGFT
jgi:transcriptional regulator with XRE-family HTH domain